MTSVETNKKSGSDDMSSETIAVASVEDLSDYSGAPNEDIVPNHLT